MAACTTTPRHPTSIHHTPPDPYPDLCIPPGQSPVLTTPMPQSSPMMWHWKTSPLARDISCWKSWVTPPKVSPSPRKIFALQSDFLKVSVSSILTTNHKTTSLGAFCPTLVRHFAKKMLDIGTSPKPTDFTWMVYERPSQVERITSDMARIPYIRSALQPAELRRARKFEWQLGIPR